MEPLEGKTLLSPSKCLIEEDSTGLRVGGTEKFLKKESKRGKRENVVVRTEESYLIRDVCTRSQKVELVWKGARAEEVDTW